MAVAHDATSVATRGTGNLSWTHTPSGTPAGVVVIIVQNGPSGGGAASDQVSGVTYGGVAMTRIDTTSVAASGDVSGRAYSYFLGASIPTGAQTVVVTVTGADTKIAVAATQTAAGGTAIDANNVVTGQLTNPTITMATTASTTTACYAGAHVADAAASVTENSTTLGATLISETTGTGGNDVANIFRGTALGAGGNVIMGWTYNNDWIAGVAVAVKETAGAAGGLPPPRRGPLAL